MKASQYRTSLLIVGIFMTFCNSYKRTTYFQDINRSAITKERITNYNAPTIQRDDRLSITISSMNPESSAIFNFASNNANANAELYAGNLVDHNGEIQIPLIGNLTANGLTTAQLKEQIRIRLIPYLK